jgi:serine/threonine-protein kinase
VPASQQAIGAIAVLPFTNQSGDDEMGFLGDGIAENVINSLARLPDLRVIPRSTAFRHRGRDAELEVVAADLDVQGIVTGRVSRRGDRLVVGVELIDAQSVSQLWGERYDTSIDEILTVESDIAQRITDALRITLSGEQAADLGKRYTEVPSAHLAYMEARHAWGTRTAEGFRRSLELYDRAIAADPSFALAHASKAETYAMMTVYLGGASDYAAELREEVAAAIRLDPNLAEAYPVQGVVHLLDRNWADAERAFRKAIELNPDYATAHHWYGVYRLAIGDAEGRLRLMEEARRLDPGSLVITLDYAVTLLTVGRAGEARAIATELFEAAPAFWRAPEGLGSIDYHEGRYQDAILSFEQVLEMAGEIPWTDGLLAMAHGKAGNTERAREELERLEQRAETGYVSPMGFARAYAGLGEMERCFEWLERAATEKDPVFAIGIARLYPEIVNDPRWPAFEQRMEFPPF